MKTLHCQNKVRDTKDKVKSNRNDIQVFKRRKNISDNFVSVSEAFNDDFTKKN